MNENNLFPTFEEFKTSLKEAKENESNLIETTIEEKNDSSLDEAKGTYYEVDYYDPNGGHGSAGSERTFKDAIKSAEALKKRSAKELGKEVWYIGVSSDGDDFAILYVNKEYIDLTDVNYFSDKSAYQTWQEAAKECIKTKKTVIGNYGK